MIAAEDLCAKFYFALNNAWGYIWGRSGQVWTEANQRAATREQTVKWGSQWIGHHVADCSGLAVWAFKELGGSIYHGSNTIWNQYVTNRCELKNGARTDGKEIRPGSPVFLRKKVGESYNRHHIGYYVGNGICIEAKGTYYGVVTSPLSHWDEVAEFKDVSYGGEVPVVEYVTMKKGSTGVEVKEFQAKLNVLGYNCGTPDGIFGNKTEAAVKDFQRASGLTVDGVAGEQTQREVDKQIAALETDVVVLELPKDVANQLLVALTKAMGG